MKWKKKLAYRQLIIPWYDSYPASRIFFWLLVPVFIFGLLGVFEALKKEAWPDYIFTPLSLCLMSLYLILKFFFRMLRMRLLHKEAQKEGIL